MEDLSDFTFSVPASAQAFTDICEYMDVHNITEPLVAIITRAIYEWMAAQDAVRNQAEATELRGYQWKQLFLPAGTWVRTVVKGEHVTARVCGNALVYEGKHVSPAQFVSLAHGFHCNAWKQIWLLMPGQTDWRNADYLRSGSRNTWSLSVKESHRVKKSAKEVKRVKPRKIDRSPTALRL